MSQPLCDHTDSKYLTTLLLDPLQAIADKRESIREGQKTLVLGVRKGVEIKVIPLSQSRRIILGRSDTHNLSTPDVDLNDFGALELGVSRQHAMIDNRHDDIFTLTDLGSTNGTYVNGQRLLIRETRILYHGNVICLGKMVIYVYMV